MRNIKTIGLALLCALMIGVAGCGKSTDNAGQNQENQAPAGQGQQKTLTAVKVALDWTPNTNHTGLYVAQQQGFYEQEGLKVEIVQPGPNGSDPLVATGDVQFGVSSQETVTNARIQGVPVVSLAAVIQHNTSGFASPVSKNIKSPKDFEGKVYGGWGSPNENAMIESLMQSENADPKKVKIVNSGTADFFTAVKKDIDFMWIFYAWTGIDAELRNEPLNMIYLNEYSPKLDYYTPVLITNEKLINENPELVKAFMRATSKGYEFAIAKPEEAANVLLKAVPELDAKLVAASQKWLSPRYQADAPRWGEQKREVWEDYAGWMMEHKLLDKQLDAEKAFTNQFLPDKQ